jgi:hypothetical protein
MKKQKKEITETQKHEDEYLHISKVEFYKTLWIILGLSLIFVALIVAVPGSDLPKDLYWRFRFSNIMNLIVSLFSGVAIIGVAIYGKK